MWIPLLTFVLVAGLILGTYWIGLVAPERRHAASLHRRLRGLRPARLAASALVREHAPLSTVPLLNALLRRARRLSTPIERLVDESGVPMSPGLLVAMTGFLALAGYVVVHGLTRQPVLALLAGAAAGAVPIVYLRTARDRRLRKFEELFPEAIDLIARALRAGHAFTTGVKMVGDELPNPVGSEFRLLYDRQNYGEPLPDALRAFAQRIPLIDARFFVTSVLTQREAGGNLSEVLDNLATVIRERFRVKRQVRVVTAHGRITGWVLVAMPPLLGLALYSLGPDNYRPLFTDPLGIRMLIGALVLQIIGTLIIRKLIDIEY